MKGFDDLHQHLLWGLDDGPQDQETTFSMLRKAWEEGTRLIAVTPHVQPGLRSFDLTLYEQRLEEARAFCRRENLDMQLLSGSEIYYTPMTGQLLRDGRVLTLGGTEYVLLEFWPGVSARQMTEGVAQLTRRGYIPILAHVERYRCFLLRPQWAIRFREAWSLYYQVNTHALLHPRPIGGRRLISRLLSAHAVDLIASDAHHCEFRPPLMRGAFEFIRVNYGEEYARALTSFAHDHLLGVQSGFSAERKAPCNPPQETL